MAWDLPTNFSNGTAVTGIGSLFTYADYATSGWFGSGILMLIFTMVFGISAMMNIGRAFASAIFVTFVFSVYFAMVNMINPTIPLMLGVGVIVGFFWARSERSNY